MRGLPYLKTFLIAAILVLAHSTAILLAEQPAKDLAISFVTRQIEISFDGPLPKILSVKEVPRTRKQPLSFTRSVARSDYSLEWRTLKGKIIQSERLSDFKSLTPHGDSSGNSHFVFRLRSPKRAAFVTLSNSVDATKKTIDTFSWQEGTHALKTAASSAKRNVTKVHHSGDDANRLVLVVMGDGYTTSELENGKYQRDVTRLLQAFKSKQPWDTLLNGTNIYSIEVASPESGADVPQEGIVRHTYFESTFGTPPLEHLLVLGPQGMSKAVSIADEQVGPGVWDQIIVLVNSERYGGSGGAVAVASASEDSPLVLLHELGHSFAGLADEYSYDSFSGSIDTPEPNVDTDAVAPKWAAWIKPATPLPTVSYGSELFADLLEVVGTFEGAKYRSSGVYRPAATCAMRDIHADFCPVCREAHLRNFLAEVKLDDAVYPELFSKQILTNNRSEFSVTALPLAETRYTWTLCGKVLESERSNEIFIAASDLRPQGCVLELRMELNSKYLKSPNVWSKYRWSLCRDKKRCPKLFNISTRSVENSSKFSVSGVKSCQTVSVLTSRKRSDFKHGRGVTVFHGRPKGNTIQGTLPNVTDIGNLASETTPQYLSLLCDGNFTGEIRRVK